MQDTIISLALDLDKYQNASCRQMSELLAQYQNIKVSARSIRRILTEVGISTIDEANTFLPEFISRFNERFAVSPNQSKSAFRPYLDKDLDLIPLTPPKEEPSTGYWREKAYRRKIYAER